MIFIGELSRTGRYMVDGLAQIPRKGVVSCIKTGVVAYILRTRYPRMGPPTFGIPQGTGTRRIETSYLAGGKENNRDSPSKGDRKGNRTNRTLRGNMKRMWGSDLGSS